MWYLEYFFGDGTSVKKTFPDWQFLLSSTFNFRGLSSDTVNLYTPNNFDDAFVFALEKRVVIWRDNVKWFDGFVAPQQRVNSNGRQTHRYTLMNWVYFAKKEFFRQYWRQWAGYQTPGDPTSGNTFTEVSNTDVVLGETVDEVLQTNGQQMVEALAMLNEVKNPTRQGTGGNDAIKDIIQIGQIDPALFFTRTPARDQTVVEVLRDMLRYTPTCCFVTDYTSTPPTVKVLAPGSQPAFNLASDANRQTSLKSLADRIPSGVIIKYKKRVTENGQALVLFGEDKWPANINELSDNLVFLSVDLIGLNVTNSSTTVRTQPLNAASVTDADRIAWWQAHDDRLKNPRIVAGTLAIDPASVVFKDQRTGAVLALPLANNFELLPSKGSLTPWMNATTQEVVITATASWQRQHTTLDQTIEKEIGQQIHARVTICNIDTASVDKTFNHTDITGEDEDVPPGVAQSYFTDLSAFRDEGTIELVGQEINTDAGVGKQCTLNTPGSSYGPNIVQGVSGDIGQGITTIEVGMAEILGLKDRVEQSKITRYRVSRDLPSGRSTGSVPGGDGTVDLPNAAAKENTIPGADSPSRKVLVQKTSDAADPTKPASIDHDADAVATTVAGKTAVDPAHPPQNVKMIELATCDPETGISYKRVIPAGGAYT